MSFQRIRRSGLYAVVVVVAADAHLAFFLPFTYFLLLHHGAALLNCSQKGRLAFTNIICATFALIKTSVPLQVLALSGQATPLQGGKLGRSADLKEGI